MKRYGFVSQRGEIIKIDSLLDSIGVSTKSKVQEDSTQPKDNYERMRPYHTTKVDLLTNSCVYVSSAAEIIARDITGNGYEILPTNKDNLKEDLKANIEDWINKQDLIESIYKAIYDYKIYGEFILEKADKTIYYMPTKYTSLLQDKDILKYWYNGQQVLYKRYGADKKDNINEFIRFTNHNREDRDYGRPAVIDIEEAVLGNILIKHYNNAFFKNYGMPAGVILVSGNYDEGEIDKETGLSDFDKTIQSQVKQFAENPHSIMCFTARSTDPTSKVDIKLEPINAGSKEGAFMELKKANDEEIIAGLRVPEYLYGINHTGSLGGDNSKEATEIYKRHELQPIKTKVEKIINTLIRDIFETDLYYFEFKALDTSDRNADLDYAIKILDKGGMRLGDFVNLYGTEFGTSEKDLGDLANAVFYNGKVLNPLDCGFIENTEIEENVRVATKSKKVLFIWF